MDRENDENAQMWTKEAREEYELWLAEQDMPPHKRKNWLEDQVCAAEDREDR